MNIPKRVRRWVATVGISLITGIFANEISAWIHRFHSTLSMPHLQLQNPFPQALFYAAVAFVGILIGRYLERIGPVAAITLSPCELRKSPGVNQLTHVFLRAKIEMSGVVRTPVARYRMELSCVGIISNPEWRKDLGKFEITDWAQIPIPQDDVTPLPSELFSGTLAEGWVHFVTDWSDRKLYESHVRLIAETPNGSGSLEIKPGRDNWNVVPNRMIIEKSVSDIS